MKQSVDWQQNASTADWQQNADTATSALSPKTWPFSLEWLPRAACLVGGTVRDALLGRYSDYLDLDFVMPEGAVETAKSIARHYGAGFVLLDAERQIARVVFEQGTADFAQQVGASLEIDLQRRDFTVNAIAYNPHTDQLIDPLCGYLDLQKQLIRMVSPINLEEDPLRLLRAYRQAAQLGFDLEPETQLTIHKLASLLNDIAAERVQSELGYLLSTARGTVWLAAAWNDHLLKDWFPDATHDSLMQVASVDRAAELLQAINPAFGRELCRNIRSLPKVGRSRSSYDPAMQRGDHVQKGGSSSKAQLQKEESHDRATEAETAKRQQSAVVRQMKTVLPTGIEPKASGSVRTWLTTAKLTRLVAADPDAAEAVLWRLKYSRAEIQAVSTLLKFLPYLQTIARQPDISLKEQYLLFQGVGIIFPALAVLAVATHVPVETIAPLIDRFLTPADPVAHPSPLISGQDLMVGLKLSAGPQIGQLLAAIQLARAEGKIHTPDEALEFAAMLAGM